MMSKPVEPSIGIGVLHLFGKLSPAVDPDAVKTAVKEAAADGVQVVTVAVLGHKADIAVMAPAHRSVAAARSANQAAARAG